MMIRFLNINWGFEKNKLIISEKESKFIRLQVVKKNNILVTGASGQLGTQIKNIAKQFEKFNFFFCSKDELDISNYILVKKTIKN